MNQITATAPQNSLAMSLLMTEEAALIRATEMWGEQKEYWKSILQDHATRLWVDSMASANQELLARLHTVQRMITDLEEAEAEAEHLSGQAARTNACVPPEGTVEQVGPNMTILHSGESALHKRHV